MPRELKYDTLMQFNIATDDKEWFLQWCESNDTDASKKIRRWIHDLRVKEEKRKGRYGTV